jgi:hypothetical protein
VQAEYMEVQEAVRIMQESKGVGFLELFGPKVWKVSGRYAPSFDIHLLPLTQFLQRTMCGTSVQMWQQLVGGNVMMYYVVYVFSMAGLVSIPTLRSELGSSTLSMPI